MFPFWQAIKIRAREEDDPKADLRNGDHNVIAVKLLNQMSNLRT
jgi:hypothetical protein